MKNRRLTNKLEEAMRHIEQEFLFDRYHLVRQTMSRTLFNDLLNWRNNQALSWISRRLQEVADEER